ncbi:Fructose-2,6-bisphosphatase [Coemansia sp. RSA 2320]|nr:Fructose-2,6-bisphosphatase [Coemansia sp. RSA 2320]
MVGLPARGKTYISYKVSRYLAWLGVNCRVFNVGEYRRKLVGTQMDHTFFDPHNQVATDQRLHCATLALQDMFKWFEAVHNGVAIYDATNSTRSRRKIIMDECDAHNVEVMFCESWCEDSDLVDMNIREVKRTSPDYKGVQDISSVMEDFRRRIDHYSEVYEPVGGDGTRPLAKGQYPLPPVEPTLEEYDERQVSYLRKINVGSKMVINQITSYLQSRIVYFLMNIHIATRSVLFSRHGESMYNLDQRLGGDPHLSPNGRKYAEALPSLISRLLGDQPLTIWTSTMKRTSETAAGLPYKKMQWKALDELDAGLCDGLTYEDVEAQYPEEYAMRDENKFEFRYRGGESYRDVVLRLEPVIMELERQQNIMIISHQAVLRCIYAYFLDIGPEELPYLKIPLHTVMKLTWTAYGCDVQMYKIDIDAVSTHRAKPKAAKRGSSTMRSSTNVSNSSPGTTALSSDAAGVASPLSQTACIPPLISTATRVAMHPAASAVAASVAAPIPQAVAAIKSERATDSSNPSLGAWGADASGGEEAAAGITHGKGLPLPTPPLTSAAASVLLGSSPADKPDVDLGAIRSAFQSPDNAPSPVSDLYRLEGVPSKLSVSGGHDHGTCDGHGAHLWPSQISPGISREPSRPPSPSHDSSYPGRSDPRKGSPVYLSPGDFASSYEVHRMQQREASQPESGTSELESTFPAAKPIAAAASSGGGPEEALESKQQSGYRQPLLANHKIVELHVAGHGNVDVVESTPTITLRYSSNLPDDVQKQTMALKNELVGIEDGDSTEDDSGSEKGLAMATSAGAVSSCLQTEVSECPKSC